MYQHGIAAGLIVIANRIDDPKIEEVLKEKIPLVVIFGYLGKKRVPSVDCDNVEGGFKAVDYLAGLGHWKIGFVTGPWNSKYSIERLKGYLKGLRENAIPFRKEFVIESDFTQKTAREGIKKCLSGKQIPTAVLVINVGTRGHPLKGTCQEKIVLRQKTEFFTG